MAFKFALIVPVVALVENPVGQSIATLVVLLMFSALSAYSAPFISPQSDMMDTSGRVTTFFTGERSKRILSLATLPRNVPFTDVCRSSRGQYSCKLPACACETRFPSLFSRLTRSHVRIHRNRANAPQLCRPHGSSDQRGQHDQFSRYHRTPSCHPPVRAVVL